MKKYIAPIIIAAIMTVYFALYFGIFIALIENIAVKIIIGTVPAVLAGIMIFATIERIKEIRSGEEDDLSQY